MSRIKWNKWYWLYKQHYKLDTYRYVTASIINKTKSDNSEADNTNMTLSWNLQYRLTGHIRGVWFEKNVSDISCHAQIIVIQLFWNLYSFDSVFCGLNKNTIKNGVFHIVFITRDSEVIMFSPCVFVCLFVCVWLSMFVTMFVQTI